MLRPENIEEFFGTLQESSIQTWRQHLSTNKYSNHMALDEFYKGIVEKVDALIEAWIGINGKPGQYVNILIDGTMNNPVDYLTGLREIVKSGRVLMNNETELESMVDDILGLIDSTLYKLKELHESLVDYIKRKLN